MSLAIQYDFLKTEEECELEARDRKVQELETCLHKVRRGTYAEINELKKENADLKMRLEFIERYICKGG